MPGAKLAGEGLTILADVVEIPGLEIRGGVVFIYKVGVRVFIRRSHFFPDFLDT